jgi:hypothetical protein
MCRVPVADMLQYYGAGSDGEVIRARIDIELVFYAVGGE